MNGGSRHFDVEENYTEPKQFNLMFKTFIGPAEETTNTAYFRPETAQGMFVDFKISWTRLACLCLSASLKSAKRLETKSRPAILFFAPGNLSRWRLNILSAKKIGSNLLNTGENR